MTTGHVTAARAEVRKAPKDGAVVDVLLQGAPVNIVLDDGSGSLLVTATVDGHGTAGFVDASTVALDQPAPAADESDILAPGRYWLYVQSTGKMFHVIDGSASLLAIGYSGNDAAENDPDQQCVVMHGPLPRGKYAIGAPEPFKSMQFCLPLDPDPGNQMCGRAGFLIHDGNFSLGPHGETRHGETSEGCICLQPPFRRTIWNSDDHTLIVVRDDPVAQSG